MRRTRLALLALAASLGGCLHEWGSISSRERDASFADTVIDVPDVPDVPDAPVDSCVTMGRLRCGAICTDLQTDPRRCGGCADDCTVLPHVTAAALCEGGRCQVGRACAAGYGDCDTLASTGCETGLRSPTHCGACGRACTAGINAFSSCATGTCAAACNSGFARFNSTDCAAFGGATSVDDFNLICTPNPLGDACECPGGFASSSTYLFRAADSVGQAFNATLTLCGVTAINPAGEWGGSFLYDPLRGPTGGCLSRDVYSNQCACPAGFTETAELPVRDATTDLVAALVLCGRSATSTTRTYLGAYEELRGGYVRQSTHDTSCLSPNVVTGLCSCPAGARSVTVRTQGLGSLRLGGSGWVDEPRAPARITICMR